MRTLCFILLIILLGTNCFANNVQISNVSIINNGLNQIQVEFDLSWDNSWRINTGQGNHDGVWVFFKYKTASGNWTHVNQTATNNVAPAGVQIFQNNFGGQKQGAIIHRSASNIGVGTVSVTDIRLGVMGSLPYDVDIKAFAVEMVYIPNPPSQRPIFGDGDGTNESVNALHINSLDNTASSFGVSHYLTVDANTLDDAELEVDGIAISEADTIQLSNPVVDQGFPTFNEFWCMKYEISQAGWRDFLNTLTYDQQETRTANVPSSATGTGAMTTAGSFRMFVEVATPGVASTTPAVYGCDGNANNVYDEAGDGEWISAHFLSWPDVAAYLDWSGLAPMSEIQFERICRGSSSAGAQPAVLGEFAWGTTTIFTLPYSLTTSATASEVASNASATLGNAAYGSTAPAGVFRNGIFATGTSTRITSGSSFFGVMEMSGNVNEYCIHLGSIAGRTCGRVPNGNGALSAAGNAQLSQGGGGFWPGTDGNNDLNSTNACTTCEVTGDAGIRLRGGSTTTAAATLAVSDRSQTTTILTTRTVARGGRGVLHIR